MFLQQRVIFCKECHIDIYEDYYACGKTQEYHNGCEGIIWIKQQPIETQTTTCNQTKGEPEMNADKNNTEEPKYALSEFLEVCDDWYGSCDERDLQPREKHFRTYLERKNNPEYQEYLRLKAIYS